MAKKKTTPSSPLSNGSDSLAAPARRRAAAKTSGAPSTAVTPEIEATTAPAQPDTAPDLAERATTSMGDSTADTAPSYEQVAEAAYLRYLQRGGGDGQDFDDWIEAERTLRQSR